VSLKLAILHEDADCLAVFKPAGQFTQGTWAPPGELTLEQCVRIHLDSTNPASVYLGIVHRLDRPTSGVLLWAKSPKAARRLSSQFERRQVTKEYWAIVEKQAHPEITTDRPPAPDSDPTWTDWLTRADAAGVVHCVAPDTPGSRIAVTNIQIATAISLPEGSAWLKLWPQTGRTHQLRAQAARRGMPILGDSIYGSQSKILGSDSVIALHARSLKFRHPVLHHELEIVASVPEFWADRGLILIDRNNVSG
jgi:RluA family pseudouridine synthase